MHISDYIGVIIAFLVMIVAIFQQIRAALRQRDDEEEKVPVIKKQPKQRLQSTSRIEKKPVYTESSRPESIHQKAMQKGQDAYIITKKRSTSRGRLLLERIPTKGEMIILSEIIGPPKGFS